MRRLVLLLALGFVVLSGSSVVGVHLAERGASERRAERFARSVIESLRSGGDRHVKALSTSELVELEARAGAFATGTTLIHQRFGGDRWELSYCLKNGEPFQLWVPDPNPDKRARLFFAPSETAPPCVDENAP